MEDLESLDTQLLDSKRKVEEVILQLEEVDVAAIQMVAMKEYMPS